MVYVAVSSMNWHRKIALPSPLTGEEFLEVSSNCQLLNKELVQ
jgi:hypothetical protein